MSSTIPIRTAAAPSSASGACVYGTTPGGTPRISYSRDQLLSLASSPLSQSPPTTQLPAAISRASNPHPPSSAPFAHQRHNHNHNENENQTEPQRRDSSDNETAFPLEL